MLLLGQDRKKQTNETSFKYSPNETLEYQAQKFADSSYLHLAKSGFYKTIF